MYTNLRIHHKDVTAEDLAEMVAKWIGDNRGLTGVRAEPHWRDPKMVRVDYEATGSEFSDAFFAEKLNEVAYIDGHGWT